MYIIIIVVCQYCTIRQSVSVNFTIAKNVTLEAKFANGRRERLGVGLSYVLALWAMYCELPGGHSQILHAIILNVCLKRY